ncbi:PucR family transcriptional regulator ligand-binding domain-containing protein [Microbacterium natoriense]
MDLSAAASSLPTVAEVLAMPAVQAGVPEVLCGSLDARVRWVHVSDSPRVAGLLDGGELLLSTGAGWPGDEAGLIEFAGSLAAASVAGVVLELGTRFAVVPPAFTVACRRHDLALVCLDREVKFVALTEAVHRRIIAAQLEALQQRQHLHELFTGLGLQGAPVEVVVRETARVLGASVVLENLAHEVVAMSSPLTDEAEVLDRWPMRARRLEAGDGADDGWHRVPVEARGTRWGALVAGPGSAHAVGRLTVLEQAATALALGRLADGGEGWEPRSRRLLVEALVGHAYARPADLSARLESVGFPVRGRVLHALVSVGAQSVSDAVDRLSQGSAAALGAIIDGEGIVLLSLPADVALDEATLRMLPGAASGGAVAVGAASASLEELLASLPGVRSLAPRVPAGTVRRVDDRPLARLVSALGSDHRLQEHSERMLAPLIRHDEERGGDLLMVLAALLAHPGNRSAAAAASHLSRSVFYQRLTLIGDLLDADLDDGETLAALHVALAARGPAGR